MPDAVVEKHAQYPTALRDWAGNQSGGVRRLFDTSSGRPTGEVLQTHLLAKLKRWTSALALGDEGLPRVLLLVGGPGNGKTEAIESTIDWIDQAFGCDGSLNSALRRQLLRADGEAVPRVASAELPKSLGSRERVRINIVQDASVEGGGQQSRAALLVSELESALGIAHGQDVYLACINRGVLDDALIHVSENGPRSVLGLIQSIVQAVGQGGEGISCWPLSEYPLVAVWPMDAESLIAPAIEGQSAPAAVILGSALDDSKWLGHSQCAAGLTCPFCTSRKLLAGSRGSHELLTILRWHELATGKRWAFRDLFTLVSFLLSGNELGDSSSQASSPCNWAAGLAQLDASRVGQRPDARISTAIFLLTGALYQHQLFGRWDAASTRRLRDDLKEVELLGDHTAIGLYHFLRQGRGLRPPAMIAGLLETLCDVLDPALADPGTMISLNDSTRVPLRDIDARFSQSVASGRSMMSRHRCLTAAEMELLARLAELDRALSTAAHRRRRPDAATRVQHLVRDFACRLVRRSLCTRAGAARDGELLSQFQAIVEDQDGTSDLLLKAVREVGRLLNGDDKFEVSLTTTFGQPMPPIALRALLVTAKQSVRPKSDRSDGRPAAPMRHLRIGKGSSEQQIALTFDLYRSVRLLASGLSRASLPREVNALIDATKARLSGPIVRDHDGLDDAVIELGTSGVRIELIGGRFLAGNAQAT